MKTTFEFIKETDATGETYYYTKKDGELVSGTLSFDYDLALERYNKVINGVKKIVEVLKTETIEYK